MIRSRIKSKLFKERHRRDGKHFTRDRKLPFVVVLLLIVQKSLKSLQLVLNEFFVKFDAYASKATNSAFTQARQKLSFTAFIELTKEAILNPYYEDGHYRKFRHFRLIGLDGSKVILPDSEELCQEFGFINFTHGKDGTVIGKHPVGRASVLYDVLNNLPIDSVLTTHHAYEVDLAIEQLKYTRENDLLLFDRGYTSYRFLATLIQQGRHFLGRCSTGSFKAAQEMFKEGAPESRVVTLKPSYANYKEMQALELPMEIEVRFLRIVLDTGEVEVLVTSLLDEVEYPTEIFKELYYLRWGVETFYGTAKDRLNLENFSGKSVQAVQQDFHATIFISALESVITEDGQQQLDEKRIQKNNDHPQKVNKAVSFNAIKNHVIELFYKNDNPEVILNRLSELFSTNPVCLRKGRKVDRKEISDRRRANYHKRIRKICF